MSNMSYCRFQNTVHDLNECHDALVAISAGDVEYEPSALSSAEADAAQRLVRLCFDILKVVWENAEQMPDGIRGDLDELDTPKNRKALDNALEHMNEAHRECIDDVETEEEDARAQREAAAVTIDATRLQTSTEDHHADSYGRSAVDE